MKVGYKLLEYKDEFCVGGVHLVLFSDLVEGERRRGFLPLWLWKLQELIQDESIGFLLVPAVGKELAPQMAYLVHETGQRVALLPLHIQILYPNHNWQFAHQS